MRDLRLPVTTRGIGLATTHLCNVAASVGIEAPLYTMYRVFLGLAEAKLHSFWIRDAFKYKVYPSVLENPVAVAIVPAPIKLIIDAIGVIEHSGIQYVPVMAPSLRDAEGRPVPRPEALLLSNLRETALALASPDTPELFRAAFKRNCPIPGAVWAGDLLLNADEIIPDNYDLLKTLCDEMWPVFMFLNRLGIEFPSMKAGPLDRCFGYRGSVRQAALVTSYMEDIRAPPRQAGESIYQYCQRCYPQGGSVDEFYTLRPISEADGDVGRFCLLGEQPDKEVMSLLGDLAEPVLTLHSLRELLDRSGTELAVRGDYALACMQVYDGFLSREVCSESESDGPDVTPRPGQGNPTGATPRPGQGNPSGDTRPARGNRRNRSRNQRGNRGSRGRGY